MRHDVVHDLDASVTVEDPRDVDIKPRRLRARDRRRRLDDDPSGPLFPLDHDRPRVVAELREATRIDAALLAVLDPTVAVAHPTVVVRIRPLAGEERSRRNALGRILQHYDAVDLQLAERPGRAREDGGNARRRDGHRLARLLHRRHRRGDMRIAAQHILAAKRQLVARNDPSLRRPARRRAHHELDVEEELAFLAGRIHRRLVGNLGGQLERHRRKRRRDRRRKRARLDRFAVPQQRPAGFQRVGRREAKAVEERPSAFLRRFDRKRLVDVADLDQFRGDLAERTHHAVEAERTITRHFVEVTAIGEIAFALAGLRIDLVRILPDRLVDPVPDAPAHQARIGVDGVPVLLQVADGVAHRVRVFADDVGLRRRVVLAHRDERLALLRRKRAAARLSELSALLHPLDGRIHRRVDVRRLIADLPVDGARWIELLHRGDRVTKAVAVSGLVAGGPERDGRMVAVEDDLTLVAFDDRVVELRLLAEPLLLEAVAVSLDVRLGDHVDAVAVAEIIPEMVVRIMRRAHRVDVVALEERHVLHHVVERDRAATLDAALVTVHAVQLHGLAVHGEDVTDDLLLLEAYALHANVVPLLDYESVEIGVFGGPEMRRVKVERIGGGGRWY